MKHRREGNRKGKERIRETTANERFRKKKKKREQGEKNNWGKDDDGG